MIPLDTQVEVVDLPPVAWTEVMQSGSIGLVVEHRQSRNASTVLHKVQFDGGMAWIDGSWLRAVES